MILDILVILFDFNYMDCFHQLYALSVLFSWAYLELAELVV